MIQKMITSLIFMFYFIGAVTLSAETDLSDPDRWNSAELEKIIISVKQINDPGERIVAISSYFIGTPYVANTLKGGPQETEQLVINLSGFDCFTLLDVVEALRRSSAIEDFQENLKNVRYRDGMVEYAKRRHFFSDWVADGAVEINDVTVDVGQSSAQSAAKQLNRKSNGTLWLPGIAVTSRDVYFIPASKIDVEVLSALQPGDYVGIYSNRAGLDVSHTGLIVKSSDNVMLRHSSSHSGVKRVVDEDLFKYLQGKSGLIVYRAR